MKAIQEDQHCFDNYGFIIHSQDHGEHSHGMLNEGVKFIGFQGGDLRRWLCLGMSLDNLVSLF